MRIIEEDVPQLGTGGCQHHLVSPDLLVPTGQGHVLELRLLLDASSQAGLVVKPREAVVISRRGCRHHFCRVTSYLPRFLLKNI